VPHLGCRGSTLVIKHAKMLFRTELWGCRTVYIGCIFQFRVSLLGISFIARNIPLMTSCAFAMYQQFLLVSNSFWTSINTRDLAKHLEVNWNRRMALLPYLENLSGFEVPMVRPVRWVEGIKNRARVWKRVSPSLTLKAYQIMVTPQLGLQNM
jgi:hypothetical protein